MLKVVSWNVLAQPWIDHEIRSHAQDKRHVRRPYRIARQVELLARIDADVLLLQEVTPIALTQFKSALTQYESPSCFSRMYWQPKTARTPVNGNAVLWRRDLFANASCGLLELDHRRGNYASLLEATHLPTGHSVKFVSLHLEYGDRAAGALQFKRLFNQQFITSADRHVVVAGDFNMGPPNWLVERDVKVHKFSDCVRKTGLMTHPFREGPDDNIIDHVLIRGFKCRKTVVPQCSSIGESLRLLGSDHYPVVAWLSFLM